MFTFIQRPILEVLLSVLGFTTIRSPRSIVETFARRIGPVLPVGSSDDPVASALLDCIQKGKPAALYYQGGSTPGIHRRFQPISLYRMIPGGPIYAHGRCLLRDEPRTLRVDRIRLA